MCVGCQKSLRTPVLTNHPHRECTNHSERGSCVSTQVYLKPVERTVVRVKWQNTLNKRSFPAKEHGARGDGALWCAIAARPLDRIRVMRMVEIKYPSHKSTHTCAYQPPGNRADFSRAIKGQVWGVYMPQHTVQDVRIVQMLCSIQYRCCAGVV